MTHKNQPNCVRKVLNNVFNIMYGFIDNNNNSSTYPCCISGVTVVNIVPAVNQNAYLYVHMLLWNTYQFLLTTVEWSRVLSHKKGITFDGKDEAWRQADERVKVKHEGFNIKPSLM